MLVSASFSLLLLWFLLFSSASISSSARSTSLNNLSQGWGKDVTWSRSSSLIIISGRIFLSLHALVDVAFLWFPSLDLFLSQSCLQLILWTPAALSSRTGLSSLLLQAPTACSSSWLRRKKELNIIFVKKTRESLLLFHLLLTFSCLPLKRSIRRQEGEEWRTRTSS